MSKHIDTDAVSAWYACEHPERPTDASVLWHYGGCTGCAVKGEAAARSGPPWVRRVLTSLGVIAPVEVGP